jgi:hypothetical protein
LFLWVSVLQTFTIQGIIFHDCSVFTFWVGDIGNYYIVWTLNPEAASCFETSVTVTTDTMTYDFCLGN